MAAISNAYIVVLRSLGSRVKSGAAVYSDAAEIAAAEARIAPLKEKMGAVTITTGAPVLRRDTWLKAK